jgi:RNA-directed DNA polymerase
VIAYPQGGSISPLLSNVCLHYVLDQWFAQEVKPRLKGRAFMIRFADDAVMGFEFQEDAEKVLRVLPKRFGKYGLTIHPDKTRLVAFGRPRGAGGQRPGILDFLGFVRHEVAYTAVMTPKGGHNLVCCHQYPTQTCGWSNPAV